VTVAPTPVNEAERLEALYRYHILDTAAEEAFDDFTELAAHICGVPTALISLVDTDRQWFKSRVGMDVQQTPRDIAFCSHAIHATDIFEISDAREDKRFLDNPLVTGAAGVRFYAGTPLVTDEGQAIGTLCVIDKKPRQLSEAQKKSLTALGRQVMQQMDLRLLAARERDLNQKLVSQARFQKLLFDHATAAVISTTGRGVVSAFNPAAENLLGYQHQEVIGQQSLSLFHVEEELLARSRELGAELGRDLSALESLLAQARMGQPEKREWHYRHKNGSLIPVMVSVAALSDDVDASAGFVVVAWDITDRHQARSRNALIQSDLEQRVSARTAEVKRAADDLQMLSHSVAHDLRQPLIAMSGYAALLQHDVTTERGQHYLQRINAGVAQISLRSDALLYFANLAHLPLKRESVDLTQMARAQIEALRLSRPQVRVDALVQEGMKANADPKLLRELMLELLDNAWRSIASQPLATLTVGSSVNAQGECVFHVQDNGTGFDMQYAGSLFNPFQRLVTGDEGGDGLGLGLARVKRIALKHGGRVWAESAPGQGASFFFTLAPA
jgi:PAS domain S-box-containing protein